MSVKYILPVLTGVLAIALIAVTAYAFTSVTSLNTDVETAQAQLADAKTTSGDRFRDVSADLRSLRADVTGLQDTSKAERVKSQREDNLAHNARQQVETSIGKKRLIALQKYSQVSGWKVNCVVATANTLNCLGEGYLDGDEAKESYKATVDSNGKFIWTQSYGE
jgi:hypothetical protein